MLQKKIILSDIIDKTYQRVVVFNVATAGDPGSGQFLYNNIDPTLATTISISDIDSDGNDISTILSMTRAGDVLLLMNPLDPDTLLRYDVSGVPTDNVTYWTWTVTYVASGPTGIADTERCIFNFTTASAAAGGTGDVVGPAVSVDDNIVTFNLATGKLIKDSGVNISAVNLNTAKVGITPTQAANITTNNSKVTNAIHTGEVTGATVLTVNVTAISNQSLVTAVATDMILIEDATDGLLKRVDASDFLAGGAGTDLSLGTLTATTMDVDSSTGTNVTLVEADTTNAGLLGSDKWDEIVANTAKVSNVTHTVEVTGSGALTVAAVAISNKTLVTAVATDMVLLWDATDSTLKRADVSDFLAGAGDMVLASAQTNTGIKTFLDTTMKLRNVANTFDGYFVNTNTADRIYTLQDSSDTLVGRDTTDTLTNKTIGHADFTNHIHADVVHVQVRNESGGTLNRGDAVYVSGYSVGQDLPLIELANAGSLSTMPAFAIVSDSSIANNATGAAYIAGRLEAVDTSAWSAGDVLYVTATGTTGNTLTNVRPTGTTFIESIGEVLRSHATLGRIEIEATGNIHDLPNLPNTQIWIGDASGVPQEFALSGDIAMTAGGVTTIQAASVDIAMLSATGTPDGTTFLRGDNVWATPAGSGDMVLASIQTVTGAKTFGTIGGAVGKFILAGATSGTTIVNAAAVAGATTATLQGSTGTIAYLTDITGTNSGTNTGDQTLANTSAATTHTVTLSASGGSVQLAEGSNITLTTTGTGLDGIVTIASTGGSGDVVGPAVVVNEDIAVYDGTTGKLIKKLAGVTSANVITNNAKVTNVSTNLSLGTLTATTMDVDSSDGTNATLIEADTTNAGLLGSDKWDEIVANTLKTSNATHTSEVTGATALTVAAIAISNKVLVTAVATDMVLLWDATDSALKRADVSDFLGGVGDVVGPAVVVDEDIAVYNTTTGKLIKKLAGVTSAAVIANTAKVTNVSTNLSLGTLTATTVDVDSSDGTNATLIEADTTNAGLLGSDKWDEIVANTAKVTNVSTNLSEGATTNTTVDVDSSDGTNATLAEASTTRAGLLGKAKWDEIVANTAKVGFLNLTGHITSTGAATLLGSFSLAQLDTAMGTTGVADATTFLRGDNSWQVPGGSGDMILASVQTVTGAKTFADNAFLIQNPAITFAYLFQGGAIGANRTITLPVLLGGDTLVFEAHIQTLTNKTIDASANTITELDPTMFAASTAGEMMAWDSANDLNVVTAGTTGQVLIAVTGDVPAWGAAGTGDVVGPGSAVDRNLPWFDGVTGKLIGDSGLSSGTVVIGPAIVVDEDIAVFDGTTGKLLKKLAGVTSANVIANNAKVTNVSTDLSLGTLTATTMDVDSSDGTNATLIEADTTNAGLLGSDKWDEIVANTAKVTNATHTSEVTGATALTLAAIAISNKTLVTAVAGDMLLLWDDTDSALKRANASDFLAGAGDMILASSQTNTGAKTFNDFTLLLRNVANTFSARFTNTNLGTQAYTLPDATGTVMLTDFAQTITAVQTFKSAMFRMENAADTGFYGSFINANDADRVYTLPNLAGVVALTSDITGTNSGTNTGDQTATLTAGVGISGTTYDPDTASTFALDFSELTDMTGTISGTTELILQDGTTESRKAASEIILSAFDDDIEKSKSITIESPTATEDLSMFFTNKAITIVEIRAVLVGSATPSVTWTVRHGTDRSAAGAEAVTGGTVTTSVTTGSDVTSFNDATVVLDSFVWLETTAQSGTVTELSVTIIYTED